MVTLDYTQLPTVRRLEGRSFSDQSLPKALAAAQAHAKNGGFVASLPQLLHGRVKAPSFDDPVWTNLVYC